MVWQTALFALPLSLLTVPCFDLEKLELSQAQNIFLSQRSYRDYLVPCRLLV